VAIAAGVGAIAAGKLLRAQLSKSHKFADGGLVMGPTMGMVGEAGPELIIPLNRANQFIDGGEGSGFIATTKISGQDLLLSVQRASSTQQRKF
jgi:hypothetical protein